MAEIRRKFNPVPVPFEAIILPFSAMGNKNNKAKLSIGEPTPGSASAVNIFIRHLTHENKRRLFP